jgi:KUP system potassium uptake protein
MSGPPASPSKPSKTLWPLCLSALGIVYGDIGTSPLYALRECFSTQSGMPASEANILGILSLVTWSLILVISIKYLLVVMRADNDGEGGILALLALFDQAERKKTRFDSVLLILGIFGASLLYGDGVITPAISVLSAIEGLDVATPFFRPYIIPITVLILLGLFWLQQHGTERVGFIFGPLMLVWFCVLAGTGILQLVQEPRVLVAINPRYAIEFFASSGWQGFFVLGVVFLVVTGGEALYADMGHLGRLPIQVTWFSMVLPALLLNYFGQGALLLQSESAVKNPFYHLVWPEWRYPLVLLSAAATVVASQAVISGAFSLTMQAVQSGLLPRVQIRHTSDEEFGQVFVPLVNWLMMLGTIGLVLLFQTSSALAAAYGTAITTTMVITTLLLFHVMRELWRWSLLRSLVVCGIFLIADLAFFGANAVKVLEGGWLPLMIATGVALVMTTWRKGRQLLTSEIAEIGLDYKSFYEHLQKEEIRTVPGTAIYLWSRSTDVPMSLVQNLRLNKVLHETVMVLHIQFVRRPRVRSSERMTVKELGPGFYQAIMRFGFIQTPNVPRALAGRDLGSFKYTPEDLVYVIGRETVLSTPGSGMARWRELLFEFLSRNAVRANVFFYLPSDRVLEIGTQVEI